jgi:hypothetical protein
MSKPTILPVDENPVFTAITRDLASLARRIVVERRGGRITIDSRPDETVLRVRIPIRPHQPNGRTVGSST